MYLIIFTQQLHFHWYNLTFAFNLHNIYSLTHANKQSYK